MRARIYQNCLNKLYFGQIYDDKNSRWVYKTHGYFTKFGAKRALKKWKRSKSFPATTRTVKEFDL